jgi:malate synthase
MTQQATITDELAFSQPYGEQEKQILTPEAVEFLTELVSRFTPERNKLLAARIQQQQAIDDGSCLILFRKQLPFEMVTGRSAVFRRFAGSPGGNHRAGRAQDGDQRAQCQRESLYGGF